MPGSQWVGSVCALIWENNTQGTEREVCFRNLKAGPLSQQRALLIAVLETRIMSVERDKLEGVVVAYPSDSRMSVGAWNVSLDSYSRIIEVNDNHPRRFAVGSLNQETNHKSRAIDFPRRTASTRQVGGSFKIHRVSVVVDLDNPNGG